ncbi:hypothetical protein ABXT08_00160 [Chryseobacterium sp. NRRL B-14859]|uniref:hypothetical protein n=1 Tax=unclassified Chryseobacterium TaxID=2593645 RepID=UPI0011CE1AED|nr:hypothetical protein [Chryseobacterium sp. G0240]
MIQFILMLLGLAFPNNNANTTTTDNDSTTVTVQIQNGSLESGDSESDDTGGETLPILPPKK